MGTRNVIDILNEAVRILNANEKISEQYGPEIIALQRRRDVSSADSYRIGVIGVTSSGKSTLINSLMGESILPSRACPSSSQLVRCHYSDKRQVIVYFEDGTNLILSGKDCDQESISFYADEGFNSNNKERVKELELCSPNFPLGKDVILVDSPGLDAFGYEGHEKLTMASLLPTVDLCILVTTCKTNSDLKLLSVLNTISENSATNMPVILVQNMIDSIVPSADGMKSANDVAKDHWRRLKRVVESSKLKDNVTAKIVQYSAQWALVGRTTCNNSSEEFLIKSNYQKLVDTVIEIISSIRPLVINSRLLRAKKEIDRIALHAKQAAGGDYCISSQESFEYANLEDDIKKFISDIKSKISLVISDTASLRDEYISFSQFTESIVNNVRKQVSDIEERLISAMHDAEEYFALICDELNVEKRDMTVSITLSGIRTPHLCQTSVRERVKEKGVKGFFKRMNPFGGTDSGYTYIQHTYTDNQATENLILDYILSTKRVFKESIDKFEKRLKDNQEYFSAEIGLRRQSFEARQTQILEAKQYGDISRALSNLSLSISIDDNTNINTNNVPVERPEDNLVEMKCSISSYALYHLAETIKKNIHLQTIENFIHYSHNNLLVLGWDKCSETECLDKFFNFKVSTESIQNGKNYIGNRLSLFHSSGSIDDLSIIGINVICILVNATQIGSAEKQIYPLFTTKLIPENIKVLFVVQDFAEAIAAKDVAEVLTELRDFIKTDLNRRNIDILLVHNNPIYNLAIAAIQETGITLQSDSINIANELKTKFGYLYDEESNNVIHDMLKSFES